MSIGPQVVAEEEEYRVWLMRWANSPFAYNPLVSEPYRHSIVDTYLNEIGRYGVDYEYDRGYQQWEITQAYIYYSFSGPVALMAAKSGASAYAGYLMGIYPTVLIGLGAELAMDFGLFAAALTIVDPGHKWDGGMDELGGGMFGMGVDIGLATYKDRLNPSWAWWGK